LDRAIGRNRGWPWSRRGFHSAYRQFDGEGRAARGLGVDTNAAAGLLAHRGSDCQAEAGAFADLLGREKRIEDLVLDLNRHARSIVADLKYDRAAINVVPGSQYERPSPVG